MNPGITDVASYLATRIPTGARTVQDRVSDWRTTLRNARMTRSLRPLTDMVRRSLPDDPDAAQMCEMLEPGK